MTKAKREDWLLHLLHTAGCLVHLEEIMLEFSQSEQGKEDWDFWTHLNVIFESRPFMRLTRVGIELWKSNGSLSIFRDDITSRLPYLSGKKMLDLVVSLDEGGVEKAE